MAESDSYTTTLHRMAAARFEGAPRVFRFESREFLVYPDVFSPLQFRSTGIFTRNLPYSSGRSFLEIGCGAGVTAVTAALRGCRPVVATDISGAAVENTKANARMHGVDRILSARKGDLFEVIGVEERFDTIYWNSNFVYVAADYRYPDDWHRAFFDAGYECHQRFLGNAARHLAPGGSILLGFSSLGDESALRRLCAAHGYGVEVLASEVSDAPGNPRYDVLRLIDGGVPPAPVVHAATGDAHA
jgi:methylase of polypeptide subunit release factors